jgi:predicted TPR repeat methyltransferase
MLARARERNVYDELARRELTAYLHEFPTSFDVIVSADTLVYFGPLETVTIAAANALRPGGVLVFTVEDLSPEDSDSGYSLSPNGRYRHAAGYLASVLADAELESEIIPTELRLEAGEPVAGLVVRATRH